MDFISQLKFDEKGLIPVIAQDFTTGQVLMLAYANKEAIEKTSGHFQHVKEILYDCDGDTILIKVIQDGAACHTGKYSCFYRNHKGEEVI